MHRLKSKLNVGGVFAYLLVYASWFLTTTLGLLSIFYTRNVLNVLGPVLGARSGTHPVILDARLRFFDRLGMFVILIVWAAYALFAEHRYRSSIDAARRRQFLAETPSADQVAATRNGLWGDLRRWGVDILARRFLITTSVPAVLFVLVYVEKARKRPTAGSRLLLAVGMNGKQGSGGSSPQGLFPWKKPRRLRRGSSLDPGDCLSRHLAKGARLGRARACVALYMLVWT